MISRDASEVAQHTNATEPAGQPAEAVHYIGAAILTGGVAVVLAVVAIPLSLGLGAKWCVRALTRKLRGKNIPA